MRFLGLSDINSDLETIIGKIAACRFRELASAQKKSVGGVYHRPTEKTDFYKYNVVVSYVTRLIVTTRFL